MRVPSSLILAAAACAAAPAAYAAETPIDIKGGANGQYFIVEQGGSPTHPTLAVKINWSKGGSHYIKREFDCKAHSAKYLGEGDSLQEMNKPMSGQKMTPIADGSVAAQLAQHVCPKK